MKTSRLMCLLLSVLALSCAESGGPVYVDAEWNLTCPADTAVACPGESAKTCLGTGGQRAIVGEHRQQACTGDPIIAICEAVQRADGTRIVTLEADVGAAYAFELRGAIIDSGDGIVEQTACNVTVIEEGLPYDIGKCGTEPPSMQQPCQLSNVSVEGSEVSFDVECDSLLSSTTGQGFDVGAVGGGPATIRFANCIGF
jgi:hypothetical protein